MTQRYVEITIEDFEAWLDSLRHRWFRKPGTAGVYIVPLSDPVAVSIHSSLGRSGTNMARGKGAMHMSLIARKSGDTLWGMKKATGKSRFTRTSGWEQRLTHAFNTFRSGYLNHKAFYDKLATTDRAEYREKWTPLIEEIPRWETRVWLKKCHDDVNQGRFLSGKEESAILRISLVEKTLARMRDLYRNARSQGDEATQQWTKRLAETIKRQGQVTRGQLRELASKFSQFRVQTAATKHGHLRNHREEVNRNSWVLPQLRKEMTHWITPMCPAP